MGRSTSIFTLGDWTDAYAARNGAIKEYTQVRRTACLKSTYMSIFTTCMSIALPGPFAAASVTVMNHGDENLSRGWRGSAEVWVNAAYETLIESGVDQVKIMPLARKLNLSRTSFYWHFSDRDSLLDALVTLWREKNTANLKGQTQLYADSITEAVLNLFDCWITPELFDAKLEFAMRSWAQTAPDLKSIFEQADAERVTAIGAMFARFGFGPEQADIRANTIYLTQVGYISMKADEPLPARIRRMPAYAETFTGQRPSAAEIDRFMSRHRDRLCD